MKVLRRRTEVDDKEEKLLKEEYAGKEDQDGMKWKATMGGVVAQVGL